MGQCVFKTSDVRRCVEHALAATDWDMAWERDTMKPTPGLLFVHDSGVYVMSNGIPRDTISADGCYTAHAKYCNPTVDEDWWENSASLVGGDDFVEVLPITVEQLKDCDDFEEFIIKVDTAELTVSFRTPREKIST